MLTSAPHGCSCTVIFGISKAACLDQSWMKPARGMTRFKNFSRINSDLSREWPRRRSVLGMMASPSILTMNLKAPTTHLHLAISFSTTRMSKHRAQALGTMFGNECCQQHHTIRHTIPSVMCYHRNLSRVTAVLHSFFPLSRKRIVSEDGSHCLCA